MLAASKSKNVCRVLVYGSTRCYFFKPKFNDFNETDAGWRRKYLRDLWHRQQLQGPPEPIARSSQPNWNYKCELFAFGKRLGEDFNQEVLRRAFMHERTSDPPADTEPFLQPISDLPSELPSSLVEDNKDLIEKGDAIIEAYVKAYLRYHLPEFPEEGICAVYDYLTNDTMLAYIASHMGVEELIVPAAKGDVSNVVKSDTFKAVIGAFACDETKEQIEAAEYLVQDLVLTQLVNMDVNEHWQITNPMGVLSSVLRSSDRSPPEPRLLYQSGVSTVTPIYLVGIYCDKELLGEGPGETVEIAEEMAARYTLQTLFKSGVDQVMFSFDKKGRSIDLGQFRSIPNRSLADMIGEIPAVEDEELSMDLTRLQLSEPSGLEPLEPSDALLKYKELTENPLGVPYRRRLKHRFFGGSRNRRSRRRVNRPSLVLL